jgi:hypothetical protein
VRPARVIAGRFAFQAAASTASSAIVQLSAHFAGELGFPGRQVRM